MQLLHRLSPANSDNVHRLEGRSQIDVSWHEDGTWQVRRRRHHVQPGRPSRRDAALRWTGHSLRRHGTRGYNYSCSSRFALSSNPLSTRIFIKVNAISDADKVLKHFESYRAKFSALFPMPSLKKLNNPGYYKVCKYLRNPFSTKVRGREPRRRKRYGLTKKMSA